MLIFGILILAFCSSFASAEEGIRGSQLKVQYNTVQKMDTNGIWRTVNLDHATESYQNFYVEQGEPGVASIESNLVSATDDTLFYHTIAKMPIKSNFLTKTTWDSFSTYFDGSDANHPIGSMPWFQYRMYRITWDNVYYDTTPGHNENYLGKNGVGGWTLWDLMNGVTDDQANVAAWKAGITNNFEYKYLTIDQPKNTVDYYKNVGAQFWFEPIQNITLTKSDNASVSIEYGIDNWKILTINGGEYDVMPIGEYKTELVGYENNHISLDMSSNIEAQSVKTTVEQMTGYTLEKLAAGSGVDFGPTSVVNFQNYQMQPITDHRLLPSSANASLNTPVTYNLPIELRPQIDYWQQPITVKWNVGGVDIRTKNEYWPIFNGDAAITSTVNIDHETINRIGAVYAQNYALQQEFVVTVEFFSTIKLNGILSDALLGLPGWSQGDINWDMGITGTTSKEISLLNGYGLGTFLSDAKNFVDTLFSYLGWILVIAIVGVVLYVIIKRI